MDMLKNKAAIRADTRVQGSENYYQSDSSITHSNMKSSSSFSLNSVNRLDRWLTKKMIEVVGNPPVRIHLWNGEEVTPAVSNPVAVLHYHNRAALLKTITDPERHWGDLYSQGDVDFEGDLVEFMEVIYQGIVAKGKSSLLRQALLWLGHRRIFNSLDKAQENIHAHYDIGNDFYKLWLDTAQMQYTCAYFFEPDISLEEAQIAKLHHICRKLQIGPDDTVVEAGCGWGGLSRFIAKNYGAKVTAYNISKEQIKYARQKAADDGLSDRIDYVLDDYRNISGQFDVFVSVGMLEHVGKPDFPVLGKVIHRCLKTEGRALIHTIGRNNARPMNAWIERRIFPGAYPPTVREMMDILEPYHFSVLDMENLRLHYAQTLQHWSQRFEANSQEVENLFDKPFVKAWRLYLAGSIAAFNTGQLQLFQMVFSHSNNNKIPRTRGHIYVDHEHTASDKSVL
jgi:cyclopropane-fatty-acyl-phospholipid synthase